MTSLEKELKELIKKDDSIFNFIEEHALDGIWYWDLENSENSWNNPQFWKTLGYTTKQIKEQSITLNDVVNQDDVKRATENFNKHLEAPEQYPYNEKIRYTHREGNTIWLNVKGTIIYNSSNKPYRMLGTYTCISKQKSAENKLEDKIQYYENVINGANIGSWECNLITNTVKYNARWAKLFGYTLKELAPLSPTKWINYVHLDDIEIVTKAFENQLKSKTISECEFRMKHKQGHWVWILSRGKIMQKDSNGNPEIIAGSHYDITQQKTSELLVTHYKDLLERTKKVAKIGSWELDLNTNSLDWNSVTKQIHEVPENYSPTLEEAFKFYPEGPQRDLIDKSVHLAINEGKNYDIELQIETRSGALKWIRAIGIPVIENEKCTKLFGLFQDIDANKKNQINVALSEKKFRNIFTFAGAGIAIIDSNFKLEQVNPSFCDIFGYTQKELQEMDLTSLSHPDDKLLLSNKTKGLISGELDNFNAVKRYIHKDGSILWLRISVSTIIDDNSKVTEYTIQVQDVTRTKTHEALLLKNADLLTRINDVAQIGVWELNLENNKVTWSDTIKQIAGIPKGHELTLDDVFTFYQEGEHRKKAIDLIDKAIYFGEGFDFESIVISKTGQVLWGRTIGVSEFENGICKRLYGFFQNIDEKTRIANNLAVKEEEQRLTFENASIGLGILNTEGVVQKVNKSFCDILGRSEAEILSMSHSDVTHQEDIAQTDIFFTELIKRKRDEYKLDKRYVHKKGHVIWANVSVNSVKNERGELIHFLIQMKDITQQKETELLMLRNADLLSRINETAQIGIWEVNLENDTVNWNPTIKKLMGVSPEYAPTLEDAYSFFIEGEHRDAIIKGVETGIETGEGFDLELQIKNRTTNSKLWTRTIGISEFENGICRRMYGFFQNIDEKTKIANDLAAKEEQFRQTFIHASIGMAMINIKGELTKANPKLCNMLGYTEEEIKEVPLVQHSHPNDVEIPQKSLWELIHGKRSKYQLEKRFIHKIGHIIWANISVAAVKNDQGETSHIVSQIQDITETKKNQQQILDYKNLLEKSNEVAKIGSWEIDQTNQKVFLSDTLKHILEAPLDYQPTLSEVLSLYPEGAFRTTVNTVLDNALEKGTNFDIVVQKNTLNNTLKWVRVVGISEFENNSCLKLYGLMQDVDAPKKMALEVSLREEQFRQTFNQASIGMCMINTKGQITQANPKLCTIFGYTEAEIKIIPLPTLSHPDDVKMAKQLLGELIQGKRNDFQLDKRYIHKNGDVIWTKISAAAVKNDQGMTSHIVGQIQDITNSKKQQKQLLDYKNLLEKSNEVAKIGSWEVSQDGNPKVFWSDTLRQILEVPLDFQPTVEEALNFYPEGPDRSTILTAFKNGIEKGENFDGIVQTKTFNNTLKWVRVVGISEFDSGKCVKLYGLIQDIDATKKMELEVSLREEQFRQTFWHANIGMTLLNLEGKVTRANPSVCKMFGYTEEEIINTPIPEISHPDDIEEAQQLMRELIDGERDNFQIEKRYFHKNGDILWVVLSTSAVKNDLGETLHFVSQIQNITENKRLTQSLKEHNDRLVNFAHIVSHNLRSHTGNMTMLLDLNQESNTNAIDDEIFNHIKSASDNMNDTVHYLSEIVEINSHVNGNLVFKNLSKKVSKTIQNIQSSISLHNISIETSIDKSLDVLVVPAYLESIILNLLTNAIKYRSEERPCEIKITSEVTEKFIALTITDNGKGIDLEKHGNKIFGMYKTFHEHKDARGIGLFISKNQVESMGGKIEVKSEVNKGTTFKTYFKYEHNA